MAVVPLRCSAGFVRQILRLDHVNGQIVGARIEDDEGGRFLVLDIDAPDAPEDAVGMDPSYLQDHASGRVTMRDPGWIIKEP